MNQTPLMAAAAAGNLPLVEACSNAAPTATRPTTMGATPCTGRCARPSATRSSPAARSPRSTNGSPRRAVDVNTGERLVRIDRHLTEYFLFQTLWVLFKSRFTHRQRRGMAPSRRRPILEAWQHLPANIVRPERNKRQHLNGVLSRNEVDRDYAYNRALFQRVAQGWYQFNPKLAVRRRQGEEEVWMPVYAALNLPLINEFSHWNDIARPLAATKRRCRPRYRRI
jgi:hypothetical protein